MKHLPILLAALLLLSGCKFEKPLTDKPTKPVDSALLGSWFSMVDGRPLGIYRLSDTEYLAVDDGTPYVCTHSDLDGVAFISCKQLKNDKEYNGKYAYIAYKLDKDDLVVMGLSDSLVFKETMTPAETRQLIEKAAKAGTALDTNPAHLRRYHRAAN